MKSYQWRGAGIDELMLGPGRYHHQISSLDILILAIDGGFADTGGERQGLIDRVNLYKWTSSAIDILRNPPKLHFYSAFLPSSNHSMMACVRSKDMSSRGTHLIANVPTNRHGHQYNLAIQTGPEHSSELSTLRRHRIRHVGEVLHLMLGRSGRHLGVFGTKD